MKPWLIETGIDHKGAGRLAASLRKHGVEVATTHWVEDMGSLQRPAGVFHGCIQASRLVRDLGWTVFGLQDTYRCSYYYPRFGAHLLNHIHMFLPVGDLMRLNLLVARFLGDGRAFIRPDSNEKVFSGHVLGLDSTSVEAALASNLGSYDPLAPEEMIVLSPVQSGEFTIQEEHRSIVVNGKVVSTSTYERNHRLVEDPVAMDPWSPTAVQIQGIVDRVGYAPDIVWVLDTCTLANGSLKVMEVGSFSSSSLYGNDTDAIVEALLPFLETL